MPPIVNKKRNVGIYFKVVTESLKNVSKACIIILLIEINRRGADAMKKWLVLAILAALRALTLTPGVSFTEDRDTVLLARAIYAMAGREGYDAKLAAGTVELVNK